MLESGIQDSKGSFHSRLDQDVLVLWDLNGKWGSGMDHVINTLDSLV